MMRNKKENKGIENRKQREREQASKRFNRKKEEHPFRTFLFELYYTIYSTD